MNVMTTDKAYIMGLVIGGGSFSSDHNSFFIKLPYRQWGEIDKNPERAGVIAKDILHVVKPLMMVEYNIDVSYTTGRDWKIECSGDTTVLIEDLRAVNIEPTAELHKTADISMLVQSLPDLNMKKRFIAGIADTIGSMARSHRRFSDDVQIISFEISGFNYKFVCQLCNLLYDVGCVPDQILWQHPNMQSGTDAYYTSWKKGNKLRVTLDSFSTFGSLAFKSKTIASRENMLREPAGVYNISAKCEEKSLSVPGVVAVHVDENYNGIPADIRGGHYIHHKQICAVLNCPHAPYHGLDGLLSCAEKYVSPFTVLHKDNAEALAELVTRDPLLGQRKYEQVDLLVREIVQAVEDGYQTFLLHEGNIVFSKKRSKGYPLSVMLDAFAYIIASKTGNLNGKRPRGNREEIILNAIASNPDFRVQCQVPELLTPLILTNGEVSAMVGPLNEAVYKNLITYEAGNNYKMIVRKITEDDLR